jgi:hypothetical protein
MKRIIVILITMLITVSLSAQGENKTRYKALFYEGIKEGQTSLTTVGGRLIPAFANKAGSLLLLRDSITTDNVTTPTKFKVYSKGVQLEADIPASAQEDAATIVPLNSDTIPQIVFGAGNGARGSQTSFEVNKKLGAVYWKGSDTLIIDEVRGVVAQDSGTVTSGIQLYFDVNLFDGTPTAILSATASIASTTTGNAIVAGAGTPHLEVQTVPPNVWIWGTVLTKSNGNMPVFMSITVSGHKQNRKY